VHGLEAEYAGRVRFVYLDIDDPAVAPFKRELRYRVQPHIFLLDGSGQVVGQWLGAVTAEDLEPALDQISP
jgi:thioredoxin-like negative regulator of GroEL